MLAVCVPLVLCAAAVTAFALPGAQPAADKTPDGPGTALGAVSQSQFYSGMAAADRVEISGPNFKAFIIEESRVRKIFEKLEGYAVIPEDENEAVSVEQSGRDDAKGNTYTSGTGDVTVYTIVLITAEGKKTTYSFFEEQLRDHARGRLYRLEPDQAAELRQLLGISR